MNEIWKDVKGYENLYQVSNLGRVKSLFYWSNIYNKYFPREKILKNNVLKYGYLNVRLKGVTKSVHRLVAETFIPNPNNLPEVNHKDENPSNCRVDNLEWCTHKYNVQYSKNKPVLQYDLQGNFIKKWSSVVNASKETKINRGNINSCVNGFRKTAGKYKWKFYDENVSNNKL